MITLTEIMKAKYKGGRLPIPPGMICDIRVAYDECDYVYVYLWVPGNKPKCMYDGEAEFGKEWEIIK